MKRVCGSLLVVAALCTTAAHAESFNRTVASGQTTRVALYRAWDPKYCGSVFGVVKVTTKPQHGTLSNRVMDAKIGASRFGASGQCFGQPTKGLAVFYAARAGYHGPDSFVLDISWPAIGKKSVDTYAITVE